MHRVRVNSSLAVLLLALAPAAAVAAAAPQKPVRKPKDASGAQVTIFVPWSSFELGKGTNQSFAGKLFFWQPSGPVYTVKTDLALRDGADRELSIPDQITFRLSKEGDPAGGQENLDASPLPAELRYRLLSDSDFGLIPLRMLFPREMPGATHGKPREKTLSHEFWHVDVIERNLGAEKVSETDLEKQFSRTTRTFRPSGFQVIDYVQSWEDPRDKTVMAAFGLRIVAHPTRTLPDGREAPAGVFHLALLKAYQLDWLKETIVIDSTEWESRFPAFQERLADFLFEGIDQEAIGDPFDSPSALALRTMRVLTDEGLNRLTTEAPVKRLAALAPHLLDLPIGYDPSRFAAARARTEDPVQRTLLAAACVAAGLTDPSLVNDARLGLHSKDPIEQRAAALLARALGDATLVPDLAAAAANNATPDDKIFAILALGTTGGADAVTRLKGLLPSAADARVKAAIVRALADAGDATGDASAGAGAISPQTGMFEVMDPDAGTAADVLKSIARLSSAARTGDEKTALEVIAAGLEADVSKDKDRALFAATAEWRTRVGPLVPKVGRWLNDGRIGSAARFVAHGSGRAVVADLLKQLATAQGDAKKDLARLLGATKDPRAEAKLRQLSQSDKADEEAAGKEGLNWLRRDD